ncbi:MAG: MarC family protein [Marinilabiliaceae bacterium]|nr:MarC family protein [Bacteroidales bacterium]MDD5815260.1 MarC family protein [Bacteroidales bacterium]MDY4521606.1 MarC family protein [Bacteroidales bacterium]
MNFDLKELFSATIVLFAVLDILGSMPIVLSMQQKGLKISPLQTAVVAFIILLTFMFVGQALLGVFGVDINSFAVAGAIVLFIVGLEMLLGIDIFRQDANASASVVPLAFPLLAGPASFTAILSLRAEYDTINVVLALVLNMLIVFFVLRSSSLIYKLIGKSGMYVLKKFFGIIVLAISVRLFTNNLAILIHNFSN